MDIFSNPKGTAGQAINWQGLIAQFKGESGAEPLPDQFAARADAWIFIESNGMPVQRYGMKLSIAQMLPKRLWWVCACVDMVNELEDHLFWKS